MLHVGQGVQMSNGIWLYSFLPLVSSFICALLLVSLRRRGAEAVSIRLFNNLLLMNLAQAGAYFLFSVNLNLAERAADVYLILAYFFFASLFVFAQGLSVATNTAKRYAKLIYIIPGALAVLHLLGFMTEGYRVEDGALMHKDGILSWCLDVFILGACLGSVAALIRGVIVFKEEPELFSKSLIALIGFFPLALSFFIIVLLSNTKYAVPVVIIGPCVSIYTALVFYYLSRKKVIDLSLGFKFFLARFRLACSVLELPHQNQDHKEFSNELASVLMAEALAATVKPSGELNYAAAAEVYGVNHTTLRKKSSEIIPHVNKK